LNMTDTIMYNRRTRHQGEAVGQPWGPQFQAWHESKVRRPRHLPYPAAAFYLCRSIYVWLRPEQTRIRCRRRPPLLMGDYDDHYAPVQAPPQRRAASPPPEHGPVWPGTKESHSRSCSESSGGGGVQPSINSAGISSSK
jgi:hypothetical protein